MPATTCRTRGSTGAGSSRRTTSPAPCFSTSTRSRIPPARCPTCCRRRTSSPRSEEHTSELQSLMRISYAVFCLKKKKSYIHHYIHHQHNNYQKHLTLNIRYTL